MSSAVGEMLTKVMAGEFCAWATPTMREARTNPTANRVRFMVIPLVSTVEV